MRYIYLAGPITDCNVAEAKDWRADISERLTHLGVVGVSPLRCEPLVTGTYQATYDNRMFGTAAAISGKNWFDTNRADIVLVYLPKSARLKKGLSIGTMFEVGWASALHKPIIVVTDDEKIQNHPLMQRHVNWILPNFEEALEVIEGILSVYI